jgi:Tfp pilus assembly protein PilN
MKDKQNPDMLYALADYKQLVMAYKTKHAELIKAVAFWKTSLAWLATIMLAVALTAGAWFLHNGSELDSGRRSIEVLNAKISGLSQKLADTERALAQAHKEIARQETVIQELEKKVSATSRKLLEQLLPEGESAARGVEP